MDKAKANLLCEGLMDIAEQTENQLGEKASCFVELHEDWLEIWESFLKAYPEKLPYISLVAADFFLLGKDLQWMHRLFQWGNYPLVHRILRYDWELMFRAYYADVYMPNIPGETDVPGDTVDEKVEWIGRREKELNFQRVIKPILNVFLPQAEQKFFGDLWTELNQHVHPTKHIRDRIYEPSSLAVADSFDEKWAQETMQNACDVFDLIWVMTLAHFQECIPLLKKSQGFPYAARTRFVISALGNKEGNEG